MAEKRIMVVDDDEDILFVVKYILESKGFEVECHSESVDIRSFLDSFKADLLLLDINLKDGNGRDICRELKGDKDFKQLPIILFSAATNHLGDKDDCEASGFIAKPFETEELVGQINKYLKVAS